MSASTNNYDVDPENQIEVGYRVWKAEDDCELRLLPEYDSEGEPVQCICMVGSGEALSSATVASSDSPGPICHLGPGYSVGAPEVSSSSQSSSSSSSPPIQPQWVVLDEGPVENSIEEFYQEYYRRAREIENEREARTLLYSRWSLESWVEVASWSLGTNDEGRHAFRLRPNWNIVEQIANAALATFYRGPGDPPKIFG